MTTATVNWVPIEIAPTAKTTLTYDNKFVCTTSADSGLAISAITSSGSYTTGVTCNGLTIADANVSFNVIAPEGDTKITVGQYLGVNTYTDGERTFHENGIVYGGPCSDSEFWGMSIFQSDQAHGCSQEIGVTSATAVYRMWTLEGSCSATCQVYLYAHLGTSTYKLNP
ncbi:unnamed protein product, partial [Oppiella nova]